MRYFLFFFSFQIVLLMGVASTHADAKPIDLDGLWFSCEYAHSKIPPTDNCEILDDDGFLVQGDTVWRMNVQDGDKQGCRGDRAGNCFNRNRASIILKKTKIGKAIRTPKGAIIDYLWCGQPYEITHLERFTEVRPVAPMCAWSSKKTYYISRWRGHVRVIE